MNQLRKLLEFLQEARQELSKVEWPSRDTAVRYTVIVIGTCLSVAFFLGIVDLGLTKLLERII